MSPFILAGTVVGEPRFILPCWQHTLYGGQRQQVSVTPKSVGSSPNKPAAHSKHQQGNGIRGSNTCAAAHASICLRATGEVSLATHQALTAQRH